MSKRMHEKDERQRILCASSSTEQLQKVLACISSDAARALPVQSEEEYTQILDQQQADIDALILCTDFLHESDLVTFVKNVPAEIVIFVLLNRTINELHLNRIYGEGAVFIDLEELKDRFSKTDTEMDDDDSAQKRTSLKEKMKPLKVGLPRPGFKKKKKKKPEEAPELEEHEPEDEDICEKEDQSRDVILRPGKLQTIKSGLRNRIKGRGQENTVSNEQNEDSQNRVIREIKTVDQQVIVKKEVRTKIKKRANTQICMAITGEKEVGKSVFALAIAYGLSVQKRRVALIDRETQSVRCLHRLCGAPEDEEGLERLLEGETDPYCLDKSGRLKLYTSGQGWHFSPALLEQMVTNARASSEFQVIDISADKLGAFTRCDRILFVIDAEPERIEAQLSTLENLLQLHSAAVTLILNRHSRNCVDHRQLRREVHRRTGKYINDIYICRLSEKDADYIRGAHKKGLDGSGFDVIGRVADEVVRHLI